MILVIGDAIIDETVKLETVRKCPEGDCSIVAETARHVSGGGALAVEAMVRALGEDCHLVASPCRRTRKTRVFIGGVLSHRIDDDKDSDYAHTAAQVIREWCPDFATPDVVLIADYGKGAVTHEVVEACLSRDWKVIADPHPSQDPDVYRGCYGICPNRNENQLHGYALRTGEFPRFCLKLDRDGLLAFEYGEQKRAKSVATQPVVDVCGAGDQVLATIGVMLSRGASWLEACELANVAAGLKCGKRGATPVSAEELHGGVECSPRLCSFLQPSQPVVTG